MNIKRDLIQICLLWAMSVAGSSQWVLGGTIQDVQHVVVLMQENRSFDHYFGTLQGVRGYNDRNILLLQNGGSVLFRPVGGTNFILPILVTNSCLEGTGNTWFSYYNRAHLPFYYALAEAYTICDAKFCSFPGPTFPNRIYLFTGMIDPHGTGGGPVFNNTVPTNGFSWTTYPERLQAAGVSWKVYRPVGDGYGDALAWFSQYMTASPGNPLYDRGVATVNDVVAAFKADVTNGTLPQVSWIVQKDISYSEHPPFSSERGEWFVQQIVSALAANPTVANSSVLILTYDENGGFSDHVPRPIAPPGTADEFTIGWQSGLGIRVPMIIVSPWTRGGRVCSQVFDHTSIIRFLETWTGVQEPNISAWRRQTCGDLTSVFDFANPDTSNPNLPLIPFPPGCSSNFTPSVPAPQVLPVQEPGIRPACPLPYQPDACGFTDCGSNRLFIVMTNAGTATVHFAIYANAYRTDGPWQYDAPPGGATNTSFVTPTSANGRYDFTCYGPNGFQRRFAGNLNRDCSQIEVSSLIDPAAGGITLGLLNSGTAPVNFTVTDNSHAGTSWTVALAPASSTNSTLPVLAGNQGWYNLVVTADTDTNFVRSLAGHVETGFFSFTEAPAIVGNLLMANTNALSPPPPGIGSINDLVSEIIAQNSLATAGTNTLALTVGSYGGSCALIYPGWASNYVVETSANLSPPSWLPLNHPLSLVSNCNVIILPETNAGMYFRLRQ